MQTESSNPEVQILLALREYVLSIFRERFGEEAITEVNVKPFVTECWITVQVKRETQPMLDLARELEYEMREKDGMQVAIFVQQPWRVTVVQWIRKVISPLLGL